MYLLWKDIEPGSVIDGRMLPERIGKKSDGTRDVV